MNRDDVEGGLKSPPETMELNNTSTNPVNKSGSDKMIRVKSPE